MAEQNPYMPNNSGRRRGAHFAPEAAPMMPAMPVKRRRSKKPLIILLLLVALCVGGFVGWTRYGSKVGEILSHFGIGSKSVTITLNGEEVEVPEGSTVQDIFDRQQPPVSAGNLLSVSGAVIGEGQGDPYAATMNDQQIPMAEAATTVVEADAVLDYYNGENLTEDFTTETIAGAAPKLVRQVKSGTEEAEAVQTGTVQYIYQWGKQGSKEIRTGSVSGEKVEANVVETQDCIVMCQNITPDNGEKLVALTFDDGPTNYTSQVMQVLDSYGIKGTFNLIGEQVEDCAEVVKSNCGSGNQITSHTWNHPDMPTLDADAQYNQLKDSFDVIKSVGGYDTSTMRAPYGDITFDVWMNSRGILSASLYWTHDSEDWKLPGVDAIVSNCTANMAPGSVILLHDGGGDRTQTVEALPRIIEAWQAEGYRFVTMEELMASDSSIPAECTANYRPMPSDCVWPTEKAEASAPTVVD